MVSVPRAILIFHIDTTTNNIHGITKTKSDCIQNKAEDFPNRYFDDKCHFNIHIKYMPHTNKIVAFGAVRAVRNTVTRGFAICHRY